MRDFLDRVPTKANRKLITPENGNSFYATVTNADEPTVIGTVIDRAALMAAQGMEGGSTVFNNDGTIAETFSTGTLNTTFNADGTIVETFTNLNGQTVTKTTSFGDDGSIMEEVVTQ